MKRILWAALCALLLIASAPFAFGEEEHAYRAVVACENVTERLNLRAAPSTKAESLGRFYAGTPVYVLDDRIEGGFAQVRVGDLEGYMLREYLMRCNRNYEAPALFQTAYPRVRSLPLRRENKNSADLAGYTRGMVYVLGDIGDDWRYVMTEDERHYGFVRTAELRDRDMGIGQAYLIPGKGGEWVTVCEDKEMRQPKARYYSGVIVRVDAASKYGGWAAVECAGVPAGEWEFDTVTGYVRLEDLRVFCQPWEVSSLARTGIARQDIQLSDTDVIVPAGASLAVIGEIGDQYHVIYGWALNGANASALVEKSCVDVTDEIADGGYPPRVGFALLPYETEEGWPLDIPLAATPGGETDRYTDVFLAEVIGEGENWLQARQPGEPSFFARREGSQIIGNLYPQTEEMRNEKTWIAGEEDAGLWLLTVKEGKEAKLTTVGAGEEDIHDEISAAPQNDTEYYTVYIAPGMEVSLRGEAALAPVAENTLPVILYAHPKDTYTEKVIFTGSGRFFCDLQLPDQRNWFSYRIRPLNGAEESWLAVSDLFNGLNGYSAYERIELGEGADDEDEWYFRQNEWIQDVAPGQFLELHNCTVEICYGNG